MKCLNFINQLLLGPTDELAAALILFLGFALDPTTPTDESRAESLVEMVGNAVEAVIDLNNHLFLPLVQP
ncbi:MAG: hypothetical protein KF832_21620 [Caldilineaceae bacterium]|nr:hypothetical protein [Caldilineaceae bacterium]